MKVFLKLGSLFALIIAGRYMQLTTPAATAGLTKSPVLLALPASLNNLTSTYYYHESPTPSTITSVSQRPKKTELVTWF